MHSSVDVRFNIPLRRNTYLRGKIGVQFFIWIMMKIILLLHYHFNGIQNISYHIVPAILILFNICCPNYQSYLKEIQRQKIKRICEDFSIYSRKYVYVFVTELRRRTTLTDAVKRVTNSKWTWAGLTENPNRAEQKSAEEIPGALCSEVDKYSLNDDDLTFAGYYNDSSLPSSV